MTKLFPHLDIDRIAYQDALEKVLHDPYQQRLVEVIWHGTVDYQPFIERDGLPTQQQVLAKVRNDQRILSEVVGKLGAYMQNSDDAVEALKKREDLLKDQLRDVDLPLRQRNEAVAGLKKVREERRLIVNSADAVRRVIPGNRSSLETLQAAEQRLVAAILYHMEHPAKKREHVQNIQPVFNIRVEPAEVALEAQINVPPPEITVNLPPRRTETAIERDLSGNIVHATQIERDLEV